MNNFKINKIIKKKNYFAEFLAHKFRTPLSPIVSYSEMILSEYKNLSINDILCMVRSINSASHYLNDSIENILFILDCDDKKNRAENDCRFDVTQLELLSILQNNYNIRNSNLIVQSQIEPEILSIPKDSFISLFKVAINSITGISIPSSIIRVEGLTCRKNYKLKISVESNSEISEEDMNFELFGKTNNVFDLHSLKIAKKYLDNIGGRIALNSIAANSITLQLQIPIKDKIINVDKQ